jgi:serine phosphatase RsbU (regulator of sigma subunit)
VNVVANFSVAVITYLIGFCIMSLVGAFHTTTALANAARERAENARRTAELEEARAFQVSMLPSAAPAVAGLTVGFGMRTATEVGGDYYDWRIGAGGELRLAVGDATGHGVRAGLLVVAAKTLFQTGGSAAALDGEMRRVSEGVRSLRLPRMNMALALATFLPGRMRISAGGMPPVLHFRAADGSVAEVPMAAPPAGQLARAAYREEEAVLVPGDRLLFFTDGLPELLDEAGAQFGYDRVRDAFRAAATGPAQGAVDALFAAADAFRGARPLDDDVTLVVVAVS